MLYYFVGEMELLNFQKFQFKLNIAKHFTRPKHWAALRKLFSLHSPPIPPDKTLLRLWNKNFLKEIYRNIHTFAFKVLEECSSWVFDPLQIFFLTPNRNMFAGKFVKWERFLIVFREHIIFNIKWVEVHKISEMFWVKPYSKMSDLFC